MKKKVPSLETDREAGEFPGQDLTDYLNLEDFASVTFELLPKTTQINLRFSAPLLAAVREQAKREGISYQKFVRRAVEESLKKPRPITENSILAVSSRPYTTPTSFRIHHLVANAARLLL